VGRFWDFNVGTVSKCSSYSLSFSQKVLSHKTSQDFNISNILVVGGEEENSYTKNADSQKGLQPINTGYRSYRRRGYSASDDTDQKITRECDK